MYKSTFKHITLVLNTILSNKVAARALDRSHPKMKCSFSAACPSTKIKDMVY